MANENILELGGSVDLIATAICDFNTPTYSYKEGDIVLDLKDIKIQCGYTTHTTIADSRFTDLSFYQYKLNTVYCQAIPLSSGIYNLFATKQLADYDIIVLDTDCMVFNNNKILLKYKPESIISINGEQMEVTIGSINNVYYIESDDFDSEQSYNIYYKTKKIVYSLSLDNIETNIPYLSLQLHFRGNDNKNTTDGYMLIEKAHIRYSPTINFVNNSVSYCSLYFTVVSSDTNPELVVVDE